MALRGSDRTLVAVNAETRLRTYQDADGSKRMQLDCIQRMLSALFRSSSSRVAALAVAVAVALADALADSIEILSRPRNNDAGQGGAAAEEGRAEEGAQAASG